MESLPVLCKVPNPTIPVRDITLYIFSDTRDGPTLNPAYLRGSSLKGQRLISEFFYMLDYLIKVINANEYHLQRLDDDLRPLTGTAIERSSLGTIVAGNYLIQPAVVGGKIMFKSIVTFSDYPLQGADSSSKPVAKRAKWDGGGSTASDKSSRDPSDDSQSFKMRLVHRDKGCAVCLATGIQEIYEYPDDSNRYEGTHIIDFAYHVLWDTRGFSAVVSDPFTDPANAENPFASPSTRTKKDLRRINSLENGKLLCVLHYKDYDYFRFSIHPDTHKIFSFHPKTVELQGIEVKAPWERQDALYPPPYPSFLEMHYFTSISKAMKGSADDYELDDDGEDDEELSEPAEVRNEQVRIWLDSLSSGGEITSPDSGTENKGHFEMLADMQGVTSFWQ